MLNYIWLGLIALAVIMGSFRGNIGEVGQAGIDGANLAVKIATVLVAITTLWLGLMRLVFHELLCVAVHQGDSRAVLPPR